ncbi:MAG: GerW family sporulation protein [Christensenellales bacterium]|nr:GerW family sporulation protein [Christensenellales bacterium]
MERHPIEGIMTTTMENIRDMIDVNTIIGEPIATADGMTVIPVSRVSFGFVAGGSEYTAQTPRRGDFTTEQKEYPFAGGTGAGVTVQPLGFLVTGQDQVRLLPAQPYAPIDRIIEMMPQAMCEIKNALCACSRKKDTTTSSSDAES